MSETTNNTQEVVMTTDGFAPYKHSVSVTEKDAATGKGSYKEIGSVTGYVPLLQAFGINAEIEKIGEDGLPIYKEDKHDWLFGAILNAVKVKVRNCLVAQSLEVREGAVIPSNFEQLLAEGKRGGGGEALANIRDIKAAFRAWVATLGKSADAQKLIITMFETPKGLETQTDHIKGRIKEYVEQFISAWEDADVLERGSKYIANVLAACESSITADDF